MHACSLHSNWGFSATPANSIAIDPSSTAKKNGQWFTASQRLLVFKHLTTGTAFSWCAGQAMLPHPSHSRPTQGNLSSPCAILQFSLSAISSVSAAGRTAQSAAKKTNTCSGSRTALKALDIFLAALTLLSTYGSCTPA